MSKTIRQSIERCSGFEWDKGNKDKNWQKHQVATREAEQAFFNQPVVLFYDRSHSNTEERFGLLGITDKGRRLAITFTLRDKKIRVIWESVYNGTENRCKPRSCAAKSTTYLLKNQDFDVFLR